MSSLPKRGPKSTWSPLLQIDRTEGKIQLRQKKIKIRNFKTESNKLTPSKPSMHNLNSFPQRSLQKSPFSSPWLVWHLLYTASSQLPSSAFPYLLVQTALHLPPEDSPKERPVAPHEVADSSVLPRLHLAQNAAVSTACTSLHLFSCPATPSVTPKKKPRTAIPERLNQHFHLKELGSRIR